MASFCAFDVVSLLSSSTFLLSKMWHDVNLDINCLQIWKVLETIHIDPSTVTALMMHTTTERRASLTLLMTCRSGS